MSAAAIALGMQAEVVVLDRDIDKLRAADRIYQGHLQTVASTAYALERAVRRIVEIRATTGRGPSAGR